MSTFLYGIDNLTSAVALAVASGKAKAVLNDNAVQKINASHQQVLDIVSTGKTVYGVNTGFGILANTAISAEDAATLQYKLLESHSVGVGDPISEEIAKLMLITKVHALAQGFSGVQLTTLQRIIWHIENDVIPVVPEKGSVGASGDLAPLAHLFLPLIGLGEVFYKGKRNNTENILRQFAMSPITLGPKEGLALINGTQFILSFA
ncbi:MAG TPA: aromatic amino acid ammonia-lyase, partial [Chitinophagaceae bacterium]|nr:aromatic amino acid ammonia-lyase [Chitinophagaceae bacterium]